MADSETAEKDDGRVTVVFRLARGALSTDEMSEFARDLACLLGIQPEEITIGEQRIVSSEDTAPAPVTPATGPG